MHLAPYVLLEPGARASQRPKSGKTVLSLSRQPCTPLSVSLTRHQLVGLLTGLNQHSVDISFNFNQHCVDISSLQVHLWSGRTGQEHPNPDGRPHLLLCADPLSLGAFRQRLFVKQNMKFLSQILTFIRFLSPSWSPTSWLAFSPLPLPLPPCRWVVVAIKKEKLKENLFRFSSAGANARWCNKETKTV